MCFAARNEVEEQVELDCKVRLDGVSAVTSACKRRLMPQALLPQVTPHAVAYLAVIEVAHKEISVLVVDSSCNVLDA